MRTVPVPHALRLAEGPGLLLEELRVRLVLGELPPQSYVLSIDDHVTVTGGDEAGLFYGLQTLAKLADGPDLPRLTIEDGPRVATRGVMLDMGRRHWGLPYLRKLVRRLAWLGYNRLQLHLTEWNGFRVRLPGYEDLATEPAYSVEELGELIAFARSLHIDVVPEIDLPAHTTTLIEKRPFLRPDDEVLNDGSNWTGFPTPSWTMDIASPSNREWIKDLLGAFCDAFETDSVHIGGDEWPSIPGYADMMIDFLDELAEVVRKHGKRPELWNWWEQFPDRTKNPDKRSRVTVWYATEEDFDGYDVIHCPGDTHYVTPRTAPGNRQGVNYVTADPRWLYQEWNPTADAYQLCVWADWAEDQDDAYFDWYASRALEVAADRMWGGPRLDDVDAYLDVLDRTPYLGVPGRPHVPGEAARVLAVRFRVPADGYAVDGKWPDSTWQRLESVRTTAFQGAPSPDGPWTDLAVVDWLPVPTWNILPVADEGTYRYLRGPEGLDCEWWVA